MSLDTQSLVSLSCRRPSGRCGEFWGDVTEEYTPTHERKSLVDLVRCERCAVGIHPACAVDYSEWSGKVGEPGGYFDRRDILRGALLCCKCFDEYLPYI